MKGENVTMAGAQSDTEGRASGVESPSSARVLCAGILVADIFIPPMAALPAAGELRATEDFLLTPGGCAANVAADLARLGVGAAVAGRVGADAFGDFVATDLRARGVVATGIVRSSQMGTSKTVILPVIGEDRRYIHAFGANAEFSADDIDVDSIPRGGVLYLGGFFIMPGLDSRAVRDRFQYARANGITTVLDVVVPAGMGDGLMDRLADILLYTDYFMPNADEGLALTGETEPRKQAVRFLDSGCGAVVVTQGRDGALLLSATTHYESDAYTIDFLDGSGAGDAFAAGFITGLIEKWEMSDTLKFASAIGASACMQLGCTAGVFTRAEAEEFIRANPLRTVQHAIPNRPAPPMAAGL